MKNESTNTTADVPSEFSLGFTGAPPEATSDFDQSNIPTSSFGGSASSSSSNMNGNGGSSTVSEEAFAELDFDGGGTETITQMMESAPSYDGSTVESQIAYENAAENPSFNSSVSMGFESVTDEVDPALESNLENEVLLDAQYANESAGVQETLLNQIKYQQEVIIGKDTRVKVNDTKKVPYRHVVALKITAKNGTRYIGSGFFVSSRVILTAAHCCHIGGDYVKQINVIPAQNGKFHPFGSHIVSSKYIAVTKGWKTKPLPKYDYAIIVLPKKSNIDTSKTGYFGMLNTDNKNMNNWMISISGYPYDKNQGNDQWLSVNRIQNSDQDMVYYLNDTMGGMSGSGVFGYWKNNNKPFYAIVGVHAYGSSTKNYGIRISNSIYKAITKIISTYP